MAQFSIPAAPATYQTVYAGFKGVDLTTDALKISPSRANMALNMISDAGGNPEKRLGWRTLHALDGRINGIHPMEIGGKGYLVIHAGTKLYLYDAEAGKIREGSGYEPRLPDGYQELYNIRSDGRQYADMGFAPDESTRVVFKGSMTASTDETYLFGARMTRYLDNYSFGCDLNVFRTFYGGAEAAFASDVAVTQSVDKNGSATTIDGSNIKVQDAVAFESPCNLYLGGLNDDGEAVGGADAVWEEVEIYRGDHLYRHLIPCKSGALVGFYDMINGGMHVSANDTPFIAGAEVHGAIKEGINDHKSTSFAMNDKLYILTGAEMLELSADEDGEIVIKDPTADGYIPTTSISRPMGEAGGGVAFEGVNLLQAQRKNLFFGDGVATIAQLDVTDIDSVISVKIDGEDVTDYTVDTEKGQVTFTTAPVAPEVNGRDNIEILFSKATEGSADKIRKCTICTTYLDGYAFVSGNTDTPNVDYRCGFDDPTYWPDLGYHKIGNESKPICGYLHVGSRLAIVKAQSVREPAIYFRDMQTGSDGKAVFPVTQGAGGVGAAGQAFANLLGDPMFMSPSGIYGISSSVITSADIVENRSHYVDRELCKHDLSKACMAVWNGYLIAAVDGVAFVLDGNQQKSWRSKDGGSYVYECYHWDNIPAVTMLTVDDTLYFGAEDGRFCRFNNDVVDSNGEIKMAAYNDDGKAITAVWATLADDDNYIGQYKTMLKRGCSVTIKPFTRSSVEISVQTERDKGRFIRYQTMDILNWEQLDFERFTFNGIDSPQTVALNRKVKKYLTAQIIVKNNTVNEAFGLYKIEKRYTRGGYSKR